MTNQNQRHAAIRLYKELHRIGRDYPNPRYEFHHKLRGMFEKNRHLTDPQQISDKLKFLEYIKKETLSLISLAKYREMKRRYGSS
ncbi:LYR motif-containing protein 5A [Wallemia ichthyophaga EXF-994]|uniref:LYR motif-containing protein 5A n=1 Tax=Wallemia ichthyophaga (strain EXF-994 / CBS 113033) TaxID=1299270 RepID=R9ARQ9_WALI9|nr:LYR motif-containing protein 5A [Wallemia ichthyophaga EXF-994]EOR04939.1 LYR motif-containing protein 5A [Wallemia ichthyophaga EXF-994]